MIKQMGLHDSQEIDFWISYFVPMLQVAYRVGCLQAGKS